MLPFPMVWQGLNGGPGYYAFGTIQTPFGTSPQADSGNATVTFTSSDSSVTITGNSTTDTVDFVVGSLGGYVLKAGDTMTGALVMAGTAGANGYTQYNSLSSVPVSTASGMRLYGDSTGRFTWKNAGTGTFSGTFSLASLTADRVFTWPDTTGTIAVSGATLASGGVAFVNGGVIDSDPTNFSWNNSTNIMTATKIIVSAASLVSVPSIYVTGAVITGGTGTTNTPHFLMEPTGATAYTSWNTAGTFFGINSASGFAGSFLTFSNNGTFKFAVDANGKVSFGTTGTSGIQSSSGVPIIYQGTNTGLTSGNGDLVLTSRQGFGVILAASASGSTVSRLAVSGAGLVAIDASSAGGNLIQAGTPLDIFSNSVNGYIRATTQSSTLNAGFVSRRSRDSGGSPAAVQNNDVLTFLGGIGYGTTYPSSFNASIQLTAAETFSNTAQGTNIVFNTTAVTTTTLREVGRFTNAGRFGIGIANPSGPLHVMQSSTGTMPVYFDTYGANSTNSTEIYLRGYGGTFASPSTIASGTRVLRILGQGYDGTAIRQMVELVGAADGSPASSTIPGRWVFSTTPSGGSSTEAMRIDSSQRVGIGVTSVTAVLHIKAGTASSNTAPLKLTSGTNLTTAEAGAFEYDGTNLFFTRTGTTRETINVSSVGAAPVTVAAGAVLNRYGGANNFLGDPVAWETVVLNGVTYKRPLYT